MPPGGAARLLLFAALPPPAATDPPPPKDFTHYPQHAIGDSSHPNGHCIDPPIQLKMKGCPADDWPNKCFEVASKDCLADDDCQAFALLQQHGGNYQTCKCSRSLCVFFRSLREAAAQTRRGWPTPSRSRSGTCTPRRSRAAPAAVGARR